MIQFDIGFKVDAKSLTSQLDIINKEISNAFTPKNGKTGTISKELGQAIVQARTFSSILEKVSTDKGISFIGLNSELRKAGTSMNALVSDLVAGGSAFQGTANEALMTFAQANRQVITMNSHIQEMGRVLLQSFKFTMAQQGIQALQNSIQDTIQWVQELDSALNNIQIVSGKTAVEMEAVSEQIIERSRALRVAAQDYAEAATIYYQQGLQDTEVQRRTEITIKAAQAANESTKAMSDMLTAVWNTYDMQGKELENAASVGAKLGAETAIEFRDIAEAMQISATAASQMGVSYNSLASIIATVGSTTRQSASVIGNAYKTIFNNFQRLKVDGENGEVTLKAASQQLQALGINLLDASGQVKDLDEVIMQAGQSWDTYSKNEQLAIAQIVGGTRQFGQFLALMNNFDYYLQNLNSANAETGAETLEEQYAISLDTIESHAINAQEAWDRALSDFADPEVLKGLLSGLEDAGNLVGDIVDGFGGLEGILITVSSILIKRIPSGLNSIKQIGRDLYDSITPNGIINRINKDSISQVNLMKQNITNSASNIYGSYSEGEDPNLTAQRNQYIRESISLYQSKIDVTNKSAIAQAQLNQVINNGNPIEKAQAEALKSQIQQRQANILAINDEIAALSKRNQANLVRNQNNFSQTRTNQSLFTTSYAATAEDISSISATGIKNLLQNAVQASEKVNSLRNHLNELNIVGQKLEIIPEDSAKYIDDIIKNLDKVDKAIQDNTIEENDFVSTLKEAITQARILGESLEEDDNEKKFTANENETLGTASDLINAGENNIDEQQRLSEAAAEAETRLKSFSSSMGEVTNQSFVMVGGLFQVQGAIQMLQGALADGNLTFGEFLGFLMMFGPGIKDMVTSINALSKAQMVNNAITKISGGQFQSLSQISTKLAQLLGLTTAATTTNTAAQGANTAGLVANTAAKGANAAGNAAITASATAATAATMALNAALMALGIGVIIALVYALVEAVQYLYSVWKNSTPEQQLKNQKEGLENLKAAAEEATAEAENLRSAFDSYTSVREQLDNCVEGTQEWRDALRETNDAAIELINQLDNLDQIDISGLYEKTENGFVINEERMQEIQDQVDQQASNAQYAANLGQISYEQNESRAELLNTSNKMAADNPIGWGMDYISSQLGLIPRMTGLTPENMLNNLIADTLTDHLDEFAEMTDEQIKDWLKMHGAVMATDAELENYVDVIRSQITASNNLLEKTNLVNEMQIEEMFPDQSEATKNLLQNQLELSTEQGSQTSFLEDILYSDFSDKLGILTNGTYQDLANQLGVALGQDLTAQKNFIHDGFMWFENAQGESIKYTKEQVLSTIAATQSLDGLKYEVDEVNSAISNIRQDSNTEGLIKFLEEGNLEGLTEAEFEALKTNSNLYNENGEFDVAKTTEYLSSQGLNDDLAKQQAELLQESINNYNKGLESLDEDIEKHSKMVQDAWDDLQTEEFKDSFEDLTLAEKKALQTNLELAGSTGQLSAALTILKEEGFEAFMDFIEGITAKATDFSSAADNFDSNMELINQIMTDFTVSEEDLSNLGLDQSIIDAFFTPIGNGMLALTGSAQDFYDIVSMIEMQKFNAGLSEFVSQQDGLEDAQKNLIEAEKILQEELNRKLENERKEAEESSKLVDNAKNSIIDSFNKIGEAINSNDRENAKQTTITEGANILQNGANLALNFINRALDSVVDFITGNSENQLQNRIEQAPQATRDNLLDNYQDDEGMLNRTRLDILQGYGLEVDPTIVNKIHEGTKLTEQELNIIIGQLQTVDISAEGLEKRQQEINQQLEKAKEQMLVMQSLQRGEKAGIDTSDILMLANYLGEVNDHYAENRVAAVSAATAQLRYDQAIESVTNNMEDWEAVINDTNAGWMEQATTSKEVKEAIADLLDVDVDDLGEDFEVNAEALELLNEAANGTGETADEAYKKLQKIAALNIVSDFDWGDTLNTEQLSETISSIQDQLSGLGDGVNIADALGGNYDAFLAQLNSMIPATGATIDQINDMLTSMDMDPVTVDDLVQAGTADMAAEGQENEMEQTTSTQVTGWEPQEGGGIQLPITVSGQDVESGEVGTVDIPGWSFKKVPAEGENTTEVGVPTYKFRLSTDPSGDGATQLFTSQKGQSKRQHSSPPSSGGNKGGGGGGGGKKSTYKKPTPKVRYTNRNNQISRTQQTVEKLAQAEDQLYGKAKLAAMQKKSDLIVQQVKDYKALYDEAVAYREQDMQDLAATQLGQAVPMQIDAEGNILNQEEMDDYMREWKDRIDAIEDEGAKEAEQRAYDVSEQAYTYYKEAQKKALEAMKEAVSQLGEWIQNEIEKRQYQMEIDIKVSDRQLSLLEFTLEELGSSGWITNWEDGLDNVIDQVYTIMDAGESTIDSTEKLIDLFDDVNNGGLEWEKLSDDMKNMFPKDVWEEANANGTLTNDILEAISDNTDKLLDYAGQLTEAWVSAWEKIGEAMDSYLEQLERARSPLETQAEILETFISVADQVGWDVDKIDKYNELLDKQTDILEANYEASVKQAAATQDALDAMEPVYQDYLERFENGEITGQQFDVIQEQYYNLVDANQDAISQMTSDWSAYVENLQEKFEIAQQQIIKTWNDGIGNMWNDLAESQEGFDLFESLRTWYLDDFNKDYGLTTLTNQIEDAMDSISDPSRLKEYDDFMAEIVAKQEEGYELSQGELDVLNARFQLMQAQDAYEEAKNNKNTMRLTRDASGNYSYVYSSDSTENQEQGVLDAQKALHDAEEQYLSDSESRWYEWMLKKYDLVVNTDWELYAHDEEYRRQFQLQWDQLTQAMQNATNDVNNALTYTDRTYEETAIHHMTNTESMNQANAQYNEQFQILWDEIQAKYEETDQKVQESASLIIDSNLSLEDAANDLMGTIDDTMSNMMDTTDELADNMSSNMQTMIEDTASWSDSIIDEINAVIAKYKELYEMQTSVMQNHTGETRNYTWQQDETGWWYGDGQGGYMKSGWYQIDGKWYFFNDEGYMETGVADAQGNLWVDDGNYRVDSSGAYVGDDAPNAMNPNHTVGDWTAAVDTKQWGANYEDIANGQQNGGLSNNESDYIREYKWGVQNDEHSPGWHWDANEGNWWYATGYEAGQYVKNQTILYKGKRYDFDSNGWLTSDENGYAEGGYTGNKGIRGVDSIPAMLAPGEYVLNADDTTKILSAVQLLRGLSSGALTAAANAIAKLANGSIPQTTQSEQIPVQQDVHIEATFPNVSVASEIEDALNNLVNETVQLIGAQNSRRM